MGNNLSARLVHLLRVETKQINLFSLIASKTSKINFHRKIEGLFAVNYFWFRNQRKN
jgi:hypothetical protein